jgi:hypothetical protein
MALVQGIYDLGKPGREWSLYTNRLADAASIRKTFLMTPPLENFGENPRKRVTSATK